MSVCLLRLLSIGYLLLPNLLFYFYWTRPIVAVAGIGLLLYLFVKQGSDKSFSSEKTLSRIDWFYLGLLALFMTVISGITGLCYQTGDMWAHNTKFYDLFIHNWPLQYPATGPTYSYYFGYYLIPAFLSKLIGVLSEALIFLWTLAGLLLGIAWLYLVLNGKLTLVIFCICIGDPANLVMDVMEKLGIQLGPSSGSANVLLPLLSSLVFVPNQVIPALLLAAMLVYILKNGLDIEMMILPIALSFWWAAFPALICGLLTGIMILRKWALAGFSIAWWTVIGPVGLPALASLPVLILYGSHTQITISGFIWNFEDSLINRCISIVFTVLIFFLTYKMVRNAGSTLPYYPFYIALTFVALFPFYQIGLYNDLNTRGMLPCTIIIGLYLLEPLSNRETYASIREVLGRSWLSYVLAAIIISSFYWPFRVVRQALRTNIVTARILPDQVTFRPLPYDSYSTIYELAKNRFSSIEANQYLGKEDSFYEKYVSRKN